MTPPPPLNNDDNDTLKMSAAQRERLRGPQLGEHAGKPERRSTARRENDEEQSVVTRLDKLFKLSMAATGMVGIVGAALFALGFRIATPDETVDAKIVIVEQRVSSLRADVDTLKKATVQNRLLIEDQAAGQEWMLYMTCGLYAQSRPGQQPSICTDVPRVRQPR